MKHIYIVISIFACLALSACSDAPGPGSAINDDVDASREVRLIDYAQTQASVTVKPKVKAPVAEIKSDIEQESAILEQLSQDVTSLATPSNIEDTQQAVEADAKLYRAALQSLNTAECDRIISDSLQEDCREQIAQQRIFNDAFTNQDASICDQLENEVRRITCKAQIN